MCKQKVKKRAEYNPDHYLTDLEAKQKPLYKHLLVYVKVTTGSTICVLLPINVRHSKYNVFIDTGATRCCMTEAYHQTLTLPNLKHQHQIKARSA